MPHHIEVFTGNCDLCRRVVDLVTVGKCGECTLEVTSVDSSDFNAKAKLAKYGISAVPSIVIDGRIKVVGVPAFSWFCSDEFYSFLEKNYPLLVKIDK